jgi:hypothetical protein
MLETKRATITVPDWWNSGVVLDIAVETVIRDEAPRTAQDLAESSKTKSWVEGTIDSVQVRQLERVPQCSIQQFDPSWGTDDEAKAGVGFFRQ